jgi:hypothetical protein
MFVASSSLLTRLLLADRQQTIVASGADLIGSVGWGSEEIVYIRDSAMDRGGAGWLVAAIFLAHLNSVTLKNVISTTCMALSSRGASAALSTEL